GKARDLLIGGEDSDHLNGQQDDDILIGGSTSFDSNTAALLQIFAELNSSDSFSVRVDKLRNGMGGPKLDGTTLIDDGTRDMLQGGPGMDWFLIGADDKITGKHKEDQVN